MKPELTEAEHYQVEDKPSPCIAWLATSVLAGLLVLSIIAGLALIGGE